MPAESTDPAAGFFSAADLNSAHAREGRLYHEFLRAPSLSLGLYVLEAGSADPQSHHTEDEAYVVLEGRAMFTAGAETRPVAPGDVLYVRRAIPHRFHDIAETLRIIVLFAPPEGSCAS